MAAERGVILSRSWCDGRSITATSEAANLPADDLLNEAPGTAWESAASGTHTLSGDFGQDRPVNALCLWGHNLDIADTVTWRLADDAGMTTNKVENVYQGRYQMATTGVYPWDNGGGPDDSDIYQAPYVVAYLTATVVRRYWELEIARPSAVSRARRLMMGYAWQPDDNFSWGINIRWHDPSELFRTRGRSLYSQAETPKRVGSIEWEWLAQAGARAWDDIVYSVGRRNDVLFIPFPSSITTPWERERIVLARIVDVEGPSREQHGYVGTMNFEEV